MNWAQSTKVTSFFVFASSSLVLSEGEEEEKSWRVSRFAQKYMPTNAHNRAIVLVSLAKLPKLFKRAASKAANWAAAVFATTAGAPPAPVLPFEAAAAAAGVKMMAVLGGRVNAKATNSRAERRRRDCESEERTALDRREV